MRLRSLWAAFAAALLFALPAPAQTDAGTAPSSGASTTKKSSTSKKKRKSSKKKRSTRSQREPEHPTVPGDLEAPLITHQPVTEAVKGRPLAITAEIEDPSGVFQPLLYLRKRGMGRADFIPIKLLPSKTNPGEWSVELSPLLLSDDLEYYLEAYDWAGNGPARAGTPAAPLPIAVGEEKKIIVAPPPPPTNVTVRPKAGPPAITHSAVSAVNKGQAVEINARIAGEAGVTNPSVMYRHVGEKEFHALPMGNVGAADEYTATIPAREATGDIEYYVEAYDQYGNGPGRSGAPNAPFIIKIAQPPPPPAIVKAPVDTRPKVVQAPFRANPGRAVGWMLMGGFVGAGAFAGGYLWAGSQARYAADHSPAGTSPAQLAGVRDNANAYDDRAKIAGIVAGAALVTSIVFLVVFPAYPETTLSGSGGDVAIRF